MDEKSMVKGSETVDAGRREALAKLGAYAAFTVPAVTGLLVSKKASALSICVGPICPVGENADGNKLPDANGVSKADQTRST